MKTNPIRDKGLCSLLLLFSIKLQLTYDDLKFFQGKGCLEVVYRCLHLDFIGGLSSEY